MDTKKEDTDVRTAPEAPAMPAPGEPGPSAGPSPYMGQWTWRMILWKDFSRPSGASQSRRWTPILWRERERERRMLEKA